MTDHPITPPPELVEQWVQATESNDCIGAFPTNFEKRICIAAARWGADQELEACCKWLSKEVLCESNVRRFLRAARRPKPLSLKEQAFDALHGIHDQGPTPEQVAIIRRALEALPE